MKGYIIKCPSREELAETMFFHGRRVSFTIKVEGMHEEVWIMAKVTGAESDGTYRDDVRNGMVLNGNCHGRNPLRSERFECLYNLSDKIEGDTTYLGIFRSGADINAQPERKAS